jgi:biotin operon repressor
MDKIRDRRSKGFFMTDNRFVDEGHMAALPDSAVLVYFSLCRHANTDQQCFPSYTKLQEETGKSRGTVAKAITALIEGGYLRKLSIGHSTGHSNVYEIMDLPDLDQFKNQTSSKNELVQKLNSTSSKIELELVQKLNSKNTNKKTNEKDNSGEGEKNLPEMTTEVVGDTRKGQATWKRDLGGLANTQGNIQGVREKAKSAMSKFTSPEEKEAFTQWAIAELKKDWKPAQALDKAGWVVRNLDTGKDDDLLAMDLLTRFRDTAMQVAEPFCERELAYYVALINLEGQETVLAQIKAKAELSGKSPALQIKQLMEVRSA